MMNVNIEEHKRVDNPFGLIKRDDIKVSVVISKNMDNNDMVLELTFQEDLLYEKSSRNIKKGHIWSESIHSIKRARDEDVLITFLPTEDVLVSPEFCFGTIFVNWAKDCENWTAQDFLGKYIENETREGEPSGIRSFDILDVNYIEH